MKFSKITENKLNELVGLAVSEIRSGALTVSQAVNKIENLAYNSNLKIDRKLTRALIGARSFS